MKLRFRHRTLYAYAVPVRLSSNDLRLHPRIDEGQEPSFFILRVLPSAKLNRFNDFCSNLVHHADIDEPHTEAVFEATATVRTCSRYSVTDPMGATVESLARVAHTEDTHIFVQETRLVALTPEIWREAVDTAAENPDAFDCAVALMERVHSRSRYVPGVTGVGTTSREFYTSRQGVCQDYAHLLLAYCRALLIPARYVGGYLYDARRKDIHGAHASHAWVEVWIPGKGWFGMDPTNRRLAGSDYIRVSVGRDYNDSAPVRGTFVGTGLIRMDVTVHVEEA